MFSDRQYSLLRYSVNAGAREAPIAESFLEEVKAVIGSAVPVAVSERFAEAVQGSAQGTVSLVFAFAAASGLLTEVRLSANEAVSAKVAEALQTAVSGSKDAYAALTAREDLEATVWGSKDLLTALTVKDILTAEAAGSKDILLSQMLTEALGTVLAATTQTTETASFQLTIPPGGELRIDSDVFTVLLNGQNALHTQSGDWITVSRELLRLLIESASGGQLEGQLIYTERFL